jgi:hypothetical protein
MLCCPAASVIIPMLLLSFSSVTESGTQTQTSA